jgi:hypothetical protein
LSTGKRWSCSSKSPGTSTSNTYVFFPYRSDLTVLRLDFRPQIIALHFARVVWLVASIDYQISEVGTDTQTTDVKTGRKLASWEAILVPLDRSWILFSENPIITP